MRVDIEAGQVYRTFTTALYTYERPVGELGTNGYVKVSAGGNHQIYVHRLVWAVAHDGAIDDRLIINHKNSIRRDNRIANLELLTYRANAAHAAVAERLLKGEKHPNSRVTDDEAREIRRAVLAGEGTYKQLAERFGISKSLISHIMIRYGRFRDLFPDEP